MEGFHNLPLGQTDHVLLYYSLGPYPVHRSEDSRTQTLHWGTRHPPLSPFGSTEVTGKLKLRESKEVVVGVVGQTTDISGRVKHVKGPPKEVGK